MAFKQFARHYFDAGYSIVMVNGKRPDVTGTEWNRFCNKMITEEELENFENKAKHFYGIGLCAGPASGVMFIDVDNDKPEYVDKVLDIIGRDSIRRKGAKGFLSIHKYNAEIQNQSFGTQSTKVTDKNGKQRDKTSAVLEIFTNNKQAVMPPSLHPDGMSYEWLGTSLLDIKKSELSTITQEQITKLKELTDQYFPNPNGKENEKGRNETLYFEGRKVFPKMENREALIKHLTELDKKLYPGNEYFKENNSKTGEQSIYAMVKNLEKKMIDEKGINYGGQIDAMFYELQWDKDGNPYTVPNYSMAGLHFRSNNIYYSTAAGDYRWTGKKWIAADIDWLEATIVKMNQAFIKYSHLPQFVKSVRTQCNEINYEIKDQTGHINLLNGVYEIKTGNLYEHDPSFLFKNLVPIEISENAECPQWIAFLNDVFEGDFERTRLIQEIIGYTLIGGKPFLEKAFAFYGEGRNGKSVLLNVLKKLVGPDGYSVMGLRGFNEKFETVCLEGKLVNIGSDEGSDFQLAIDGFKKATSGEPINVQRKGWDIKQIVPWCRFIFACNKLPYFGEKNDAVKDRLIIIPFNKYYGDDERDVNLIDKLLVELPGILNWSIQGALRILETQYIEIPKICKTTAEQLLEEQDSFGYWFSEAVTFDENAIISCDDAYRVFVREMTLMGVTKIPTLNGFSRQMKMKIRAHYRQDAFSQIKQKLSQELWREYFDVGIDMMQKRCYYGIKMNGVPASKPDLKVIQD